MAGKRLAAVDSIDVPLEEYSSPKDKRPRTDDSNDKQSQNDDSAAQPRVNTQDTQEYEMWDPHGQDHSDATKEHFRQESASVSGTKIALGEENGKLDNKPDADESNIKITNKAGMSAEKLHDTGSTSVGAESVSVSPVTLWKSTSLEGDAITCRSVFPNADLHFVYNTLAKHRADPNRLNIMIDRLLDGSQNNTPSTSTDSGRGTTEEETKILPEDELYRDVKKVIQQIKERKPDMDLDVTEAYLMLQQNIDNVERVDIVTETFLALAEGAHGNRSNSSESSPIFDNAVKLSREFPDLDPSVIYDLLENESSKKTSLETLRKMLSSMKGNSKGLPRDPPVGLDNSEPDDPLYRDDPVYQDMKKISRVFPHRDQNEIYALVEAHYYKKDRVQVVIDELVMLERGSQSDEDAWSLTQFPEKRSSEIASAIDASLGNVQPEVDKLREIFPDCDPNYIYQRLEDSKNVPDRVKVIADSMFELRNYPRLKDLVEKQTKEAHRRRLHSLDFTLEDFLEKFPDPESTFMNEEKEMKETYRDHLWVQLNRDFPEFKISFIRPLVVRHNYHFLPIVKELDATRTELQERGGPSKKLRTRRRVAVLDYPAEPDEYFFYELWYRQNEHAVKDYLKQREDERRAKIISAREKRELYECPCCFEDECLFEEMRCCADGHLFCKTCLVRSVHAAFSEGKTKFPCLSENCKHEIAVSVLKDFLPAATFSKILKKLQEEEVRSAGIEDLVECPFCSFATIMPNKNDLVFKCLNPECLKDSCRLCQEPNHVPLKCSEVEKQSETDMRTFIEKRLSEAMLRTCHRCGKHFVKEDGCNKMTCVCGATSCYVCRAPNIDYSHFYNNRCGEEDARKLHAREMKEAAEKARAEYLEKHPEAGNTQLKYDPIKHLKKKGGATRTHTAIFYFHQPFDDIAEDDDSVRYFDDEDYD